MDIVGTCVQLRGGCCRFRVVFVYLEELLAGLLHRRRSGRSHLYIGCPLSTFQFSTSSRELLREQYPVVAVPPHGVWKHTSLTYPPAVLIQAPRCRFLRGEAVVPKAHTSIADRAHVRSASRNIPSTDTPCCRQVHGVVHRTRRWASKPCDEKELQSCARKCFR